MGSEMCIRDSGTTAVDVFMVFFLVMGLVLTCVCCDSNILLLTLKICVPASASAEICMCINQCPSVEICMCIGMQEYYVPGVVCGPCVLMMRSNLLNFFFFRAFIFLVLSRLG